MMSKQAKKNYIEEIKQNFTANESVMIAQYQGLNVNELDALRKELRAKGFTNVKVKALEDDLKYFKTDEIRSIFYD